MPAILRPEQTALIERIKRAIAGGATRVMVQAPTGFGKTLIAAAICRLVREKRKRAIFTVPALSLIDQTVEKFEDEGVREVGVIQRQNPRTDPSQPVQIASVQSLQRREIPRADVVIIDEAHRWFDFYKTWMTAPEWAAVPFIGLSATPWTRGLGNFFQTLIIAATTEELIRGGHLSPFRVFAPSSPDLEGVRVVAGDYHEGDLAGVMNRAVIVADVVENWLKRAAGRPTLCFAVDRAHAKNLQQQFLAAGVACAYVDLHTTAPEREDIKRQFHAGDVKVVCNVGCLTTGVDWDVRCVVLARPTRSEMLFVQMIGRGLRTAPGKAECLILDHSDNHTRLGFVTDIHHDELDDGRPRAKSEGDSEKLPVKCPQCSFVRPPKVLACPACGFVPEPKPKVTEREGELIELTSRRAAVPKTEVYEKVERDNWLGMLTAIAEDRGYKSGWIAHKFKEKFGVWPPAHAVPPIDPTPEVLRWVKSRQIAYAKARGA